MTGLFLEPDDATPLGLGERDGLRQTWITHRHDLNEAEQDNILKGAAWACHRRGLKGVDVLNDDFTKMLHKHMFGDVWRWAGKYRKTERNLGIAPYRIAMETAALFDNARYWVEHETYPPDEITLRIHHQLALAHPFPNGNGRHARMMADLLIERLGGGIFSGSVYIRCRMSYVPYMFFICSAWRER